jgi:ferredoxin-NADP reductase
VKDPLPRYAAGSHIQLQIPLEDRDLRNAYSLVGDPTDRSSYRIAVRRQEASRGGSRYLHEKVEVGQTMRISPPSNLFALHSRARFHILIAGGVGITPILSHAMELERRGASFEVHYAYRKGLTDAYADDLRERFGARFFAYDGLDGRRFNPAAVLGGRTIGCHVYTCGPASLIEDVGVHAKALGWVPGRVHSEAFSAPHSGVPFIADLMRSQRQVHVPADQSLLEALEGAGITVPNMCRGGVCGLCVTRHFGGELEHRDSCLSPSDQAHLLMPCVSRSCGEPLRLDL